MLASSILPPGTVAHLKLVCVRERKNRPSNCCMFLSHPFVCRVEGKGRVGQLECSKRCWLEQVALTGYDHAGSVPSGHCNDSFSTYIQ